MNILFVTWDGPQVSYLESLFLPIFSRLRDSGFQFHILQFSWSSPSITSQRRQVCEESGCTYISVPVLRKPVAFGSLVTALMGYRHIHRAIEHYKIDLVLSRSTLPALSSLLALRAKRQRFIFDADGLPLDERVDFAGHSPSKFVHRVLRDIEAQAVRRADVVLTRSHKAIPVLHSRAGAGTSLGKFHVVSNGRDKFLFAPGEATDRAVIKEKLGISTDTPLIVYAGSLGPQYCPDSMLRLFKIIRASRPDAHFLVLTGSPEIMRNLVAATDSDLFIHITIMRVDAHDVPRWLAAGDLGLAFRQPTFSMQAVAPIKLGEYLLCGVPVVATRGVGDSHFVDEESGILIELIDEETLMSISNWFLHHVLPNRDVFRTQCRLSGVMHFSLEASAEAYRRALFSVKDEV